MTDTFTLVLRRRWEITYKPPRTSLDSGHVIVQNGGAHGWSVRGESDILYYCQNQLFESLTCICKICTVLVNLEKG